MKALFLIPALCGTLLLAACSETTTLEAEGPAAVKAKAEKIQAKAANEVSTKDVGELIDYFGDEAEEITVVLKKVVDGPTAEAAIADVRATIPRLNATLEAFQNQDMSDMKASIAMLKKMPAMLEKQSQLITEVKRISEIPEARAVLEKEFDELDLFK
ncbi:hypothetical protein GCM10011309_10350 [Litorimonas cladophorae]|uniref:Lipoprotein n=1 Tax=Litorimonas cladophorae TaxID=1220491 RepID=A0A918KG18_9PROT|nr:hypothetical protein [Litorimonas cladophorae]GGX62315.1 hypothetical protein GCM10011309_10350 [Litorimonas cladophorae]